MDIWTTHQYSTMKDVKAPFLKFANLGNIMASWTNPICWPDHAQLPWIPLFKFFVTQNYYNCKAVNFPI